MDPGASGTDNTNSLVIWTSTDPIHRSVSDQYRNNCSWGRPACCRIGLLLLPWGICAQFKKASAVWVNCYWGKGANTNGDRWPLCLSRHLPSSLIMGAKAFPSTCTQLWYGSAFQLWSLVRGPGIHHGTSSTLHIEQYEPASVTSIETARWVSGGGGGVLYHTRGGTQSTNQRMCGSPHSTA